MGQDVTMGLFKGTVGSSLFLTHTGTPEQCIAVVAKDLQ
jgi:hypothetical protein